MNHDRQGPHGPRTQIAFSVPRMTYYVRLLMITCGAVWFVQWVAIAMFHVALEPIFGLVSGLTIRGWVWQPFTYMFLHSTRSIGHILFNMLFLWFLGSELERLWGSKTFLRYYLVCGVGGGLFALVMGLFSGGAMIPTVGASGAIFGLIVAYGMVFSGRTILFMLIFPMTARTFAILMFAIAFLSTWDQASSGVSHIGHLGGAVTGFLYLKRAWRVGPFLSELRWKLRRRRFRVMDRHDDDYPFH